MSITVALFAHRPPPYTGRHAAAAALPLAALASRFLRALRPATPVRPPELRVCCLTAMDEPHTGLCTADTVRTRPDGSTIVITGDGSVTVRPVNGRNLGTMPRRRLIAGKPPWQTAAMPLLREPEPEGPLRPWDAGDGLEPLVPLARPYVPPADAFDADPGPEVLGQMLAALRERGGTE